MHILGPWVTFSVAGEGHSKFLCHMPTFDEPRPFIAAELSAVSLFCAIYGVFKSKETATNCFNTDFLVTATYKQKRSAKVGPEVTVYSYKDIS